ncbi:MAG: D-alanyl-D-alanine carboxypeptidase [Christensenellaceae bacterium]|nr:D-alanyl-D-alanine carboxypeptidase [Christensenellaceae bacterium]
MKKRIIFRAFVIIIALMFLGLFFINARPRPVNANLYQMGGSSAAAMTTIDVETGRVIFSKNMHKKMGMASTTKIVTALTVLENSKDIDIKFVVDDRSIGIEGSSIYLKKGDEYSTRELLYGLMLRSGNDAAVALALSIADSVEEFCVLMNETARKYGAENSNFTNPHGLDDKGHYTTAYDLAILTAAALKNETFSDIVKTQSITVNGQVWVNKNRLLREDESFIGVKTGFTKKCGRCFVGAKEVDGRKAVCVVLNCGPMFEETKVLLNEAADIMREEIKEIKRQEAIKKTFWGAV